MSVLDAMAKLREIDEEMDRLSLGLTNVERQLEAVEKEYQRFIDDYVLGLWTQHVEHDKKFPAEKIREALARRAMDPELYGKHTALAESRDRMMKRIGVLKVRAEAQRSILSAEKETAT